MFRNMLMRQIVLLIICNGSVCLMGAFLCNGLCSHVAHILSFEVKLQHQLSVAGSGGQSTQIKYLSKSTDTYNKILLQ